MSEWRRVAASRRRPASPESARDHVYSRATQHHVVSDEDRGKTSEGRVVCGPVETEGWVRTAGRATSRPLGAWPMHRRAAVAAALVGLAVLPHRVAARTWRTSLVEGYQEEWCARAVTFALRAFPAKLMRPCAAAATCQRSTSCGCSRGMSSTLERTPKRSYHATAMSESSFAGAERPYRHGEPRPVVHDISARR